MEELPAVSVIIPTRNRVLDLRDALSSLNKLQYPKERLEIIVVDDGSSDNTREEVEKIKNGFSFPLSYHYQEASGISAAKNKGIQASCAEIIVTTDDDCVFEQDWLIKLVRPFSSAQIGVVGGPDKAYFNNSLLAKGIDYAFSSFLGSGGIHGRYLKNIRFGKFYPMGCNMAIRRRALEEVGLFDILLAPGEETDLSHRIEKAGYSLKLVPEAFVWHKGRDTIGGFIRHTFQRGCARVEITRRHIEFAELIYFIPALAVALGLILLTLSLFYRWALLVFLSLTGIYSFIIIFSGFGAFMEYRQIGFLFMVPLLILLEHILHGLGFLSGLFKLIPKTVFRIPKR